eukprot:3826964-Pyramimonas_sp.AAC.1
MRVRKSASRAGGPSNERAAQTCWASTSAPRAHSGRHAPQPPGTASVKSSFKDRNSALNAGTLNRRPWAVPQASTNASDSRPRGARQRAPPRRSPM